MCAHFYCNQLWNKTPYIRRQTHNQTKLYMKKITKLKNFIIDTSVLSDDNSLVCEMHEMLTSMWEIWDRCTFHTVFKNNIRYVYALFGRKTRM